MRFSVDVLELRFALSSGQRPYQVSGCLEDGKEIQRGPKARQRILPGGQLSG